MNFVLGTAALGMSVCLIGCSKTTERVRVSGDLNAEEHKAAQEMFTARQPPPVFERYVGYVSHAAQRDDQLEVTCVMELGPSSEAKWAANALNNATSYCPNELFLLESDTSVQLARTENDIDMKGVDFVSTSPSFQTLQKRDGRAGIAMVFIFTLTPSHARVSNIQVRESRPQSATLSYEQFRRSCFVHAPAPVNVVQIP